MADTFEALLMALTAQLAVPVSVAPTTTGSNGTATSGATETMDAVLGTYQVNLIAGRRYLAIMNGLGLSGSVASDVFRVNIRNSGSSSTPTSGSTLIATTQYIVPAAGGTGQQTLLLGESFLAPVTGTNTFGMFTVRQTGTGVGTPISIGTQRELYVMYLGTV